LHPPEVIAQLTPALRIGIPDNALQAAADAPSQESVSDQLLHACKMGGSTEVDELLAARADPNHQGGQGQEAPLHWAARKGLPPMMVSLLGASANLELRDSEGQTPLHLACRNGQQKMVAELLQAKAAVNTVDSRGETALHAAASLGSVRLVRVLLGAEADVTIKDKEGNTPADTAAEQGHTAAEDLILAQQE
jgi:ankyrin repeat protein